MVSVSTRDSDTYFDDDAWFQPVTYDQTDYQDVDAYLELQSQPSRVAAGPAPAGRAGEDRWDPYAGYDEFGYLVSQPAPPGEADAWSHPLPPSEAWAQAADPSSQPWPPTASRRPRWLLAGVCAVAAAALGFSVVILTHSGHPSLPPSALPPGSTSRAGSPAAVPPAAAASQPPITAAQARRVLAAYTAANNTANSQGSQSLLAQVETGTSLSIDAGIYAGQRARHTAGFPAFGPVAASYYIPLEPPASYPHWFAVRVTNALLAGSGSRPGKVINTEYLVFTQATAGAPWLDAIEPFALASAAAPSIALDGSGHATAISRSSAALALSVAAAGASTAIALDAATGQPASPGNLADEADLLSIRKATGPHATITSSHSATIDPVFGLRTTDGGALLFYDIAARLTVTAAAGSTLRLDIPGFVSPAQPASRVTLDYLDQLAVTDPPAGRQLPARVIADYSGLTGSAG